MGELGRITKCKKACLCTRELLLFIREGGKFFKQCKPPARLAVPLQMNSPIVLAILVRCCTSVLHHCCTAAPCPPASCLRAYYLAVSLRNSPVKLAVPYAWPYRCCKERFLQNDQTRQWYWRFGCCLHACHVKNNPIVQNVSKEPHLGKYFLKVPQMGKFAVKCKLNSGLDMM